MGWGALAGIASSLVGGGGSGAAGGGGLLSGLLGKFGGKLAGGLGSGASSLMAKFAGDKIFGMPRPKVGGEAGLDRLEYMKNAFPGTTALERLGGNSAGPGALVSAGKQKEKADRRQQFENRFITGMQMDTQRDVANIQAQSQQKIAAANLDQKKTEFTKGTLPLNAANISKLNAATKQALAQTNTELQRLLKLKQETRSATYDANIKQEMDKLKVQMARNQMTVAGPKITNVFGMIQWLVEWGKGLSISKIPDTRNPEPAPQISDTKVKKSSIGKTLSYEKPPRLKTTGVGRSSDYDLPPHIRKQRQKKAARR